MLLLTYLTYLLLGVQQNPKIKIAGASTYLLMGVQLNPKIKVAKKRRSSSETQPEAFAQNGKHFPGVSCRCGPVEIRLIEQPITSSKRRT